MDVLLERDKTLVKSLIGRLGFIEKDAPVIVRLKRSKAIGEVEVNEINPYALEITVGPGMKATEIAELIEEIMPKHHEMDYSRARTQNKRMYELKKTILKGDRKRRK